MSLERRGREGEGEGRGGRDHDGGGGGGEAGDEILLIIAEKEEEIGTISRWKGRTP